MTGDKKPELKWVDKLPLSYGCPRRMIVGDHWECSIDEGVCGPICTHAVRDKIEELETIVNRLHPRVLKLAAREDEPFIPIGVREPYFMDAYRMIRDHERGQGTWTETDEAAFVKAGHIYIEKSQFGFNGVRDPAYPCEAFVKGEPGGDCVGDGHYMCDVCREYSNPPTAAAVEPSASSQLPTATNDEGAPNETV